MAPKQKRIVKLATFALIAIQALGLVFAISSLFSLSQYGMDMSYGSIMLSAAVFPIVIAGAAFTSLRYLFQGSHYGWMGLIAVAVVTLPSLCFPASGVLLYVLLSPGVRGPMFKMVDAEWGLSEAEATKTDSAR